MPSTSVLFKIIVTGWKAGPWAERCLQSIIAQTYPHYEVIVTDDASDDPALSALLQRYCEQYGWNLILNVRHCGALFNQVRAIRRIARDEDDVIVFLDMDDRFAHPHVLEYLAQVYADRSIQLTYGSYIPIPPSSTCIPAQPYPPWVIRENAYRRFALMPERGGGIFWNHLRTFRFRLFQALDESDFIGPDGRYYQCGGDAALMFPCLELSGGHFRFIGEILYHYTSNNPNSDWRIRGRETWENVLHILRKPPKSPLFSVEPIHVLGGSNEERRRVGSGWIHRRVFGETPSR